MIITTILVIIFLVILILGHELGHFAMAKLFGIRVDEFGFGFAPKIWGKKIGETEYTLNALPLGGFVRLYGENGEDDGGAPKTDEDRKRNFTLAPIWKRVVVLVGGVTMNFIIAWIAFSIVFMIGVPQAVYVEQVAANSPAETAGIAIGDEMIGFSDVDMFIEYVASHKGETLALEIRREGKEITVPVQVRAEVPEGEGAMGVQITAAGYESQGFFGGLKEGFLTTWRISLMLLQMLGSLVSGVFTGDFAVAKSVSGPVAIFNAVGSASSMGFVSLIQLLGLISVNLAVLNIMPFPALDGGRLLFVAIEAITGKKKNLEKIEAIVNSIGFFLLLGLMLLVTVKDVLAAIK